MPYMLGKPQFITKRLQGPFNFQKCLYELTINIMRYTCMGVFTMELYMLDDWLTPINLEHSTTLLTKPVRLIGRIRVDLCRKAGK